MEFFSSCLQRNNLTAVFPNLEWWYSINVKLHFHVSELVVALWLIALETGADLNSWCPLCLNLSLRFSQFCGEIRLRKTIYYKKGTFMAVRTGKAKTKNKNKTHSTQAKTEWLPAGDATCKVCPCKFTKRIRDDVCVRNTIRYYCKICKIRLIEKVFVNFYGKKACFSEEKIRPYAVLWVPAMKGGT